MKKILIFAGGTGSIALQTGLYNIYGNSIKVDVVISAYDNGKSTGECRKVFDGKILGPSDLRKNQLTQFKLLNHIGDETQEKSDKKLLYQLFEERFTRVKWEDSYLYAISRTKETFTKIKALEGVDSLVYSEKEAILLKLIDYFFYEEFASLNRKVRKSILTADLSDFSISNMYYAAAAALNGNSLAKAGSLMADILDIPDRVHLVSDVNLYLQAQTEKGMIISDEGVIVAYDNALDPIDKVLLLDERGRQYVPWVDEDIKCDDTTSQLIDDADIIIFSSGTQWSSLIPTYMHRGFREKISKAKARKYLVMNNIADKDMKGLNATNLIDIVERYIPLDDVKIVMNSCAETEMAELKGKYSKQVLVGELSMPKTKTHDPYKLASIILEDYYQPYLDKKYYFFDFDDTIWSSSKDVLLRKFSKKNLQLIYKAFSGKCIIISGNSSRHFKSLEEQFKEALNRSGVQSPQEVSIYCNGGNCVYKMNNGSFEYRKNIIDDYDLNEDFFKLTDCLLEVLKSKGWNLNVSNFENRGNCILSIKPLDRREEAKAVIDKTIRDNFPKLDGKGKYVGYINGNTTIDIMNSQYNKGVITTRIAEDKGLAPKEIVYVGDKTDSGNDLCVTKLGYVVLSVNDVIDFYVFAITYLNYINKKKKQ